MDFLASQGVSQVQSPKARAAAAGRRFAAVMGSGTMIGSITAWPTTTLTMALYNQGQRPLFLDRAGAVFISGTTALGTVLLACVTAKVQARPTLSTGDNGGYAGTVVSSLSGKGRPGGTQAALLTGITLTGETPAWIPIASEQTVNATTTIANQSVISPDLQGGIVVPPGHMMGLAVLCAAGTSPLWAYFAEWTEYDALLE